MLAAMGATSRQALVDCIVPPSIARTSTMDLPPPATEAAALAELKALAAQNQVLRSFIAARSPLKLADYAPEAP